MSDGGRGGDGKPYTVLGYYNGPGSRENKNQTTGKRIILNNDITGNQIFISFIRSRMAFVWHAPVALQIISESNLSVLYR